MAHKSSAFHKPAVKARARSGEIMKKSYQKGVRFVVERSGVPMVVILNAQDYARLVEAVEERFKVIDRLRAKLPDAVPDEIHGTSQGPCLTNQPTNDSSSLLD